MSIFTVLTFINVELDIGDTLDFEVGLEFETRLAIMSLKGGGGFPNTLTTNTTHIWAIFKSNGEGRSTGFAIEIHSEELHSKLKFALLYHEVDNFEKFSPGEAGLHHISYMPPTTVCVV